MRYELDDTGDPRSILDSSNALIEGSHFVVKQSLLGSSCKAKWTLLRVLGIGLSATYRSRKIGAVVKYGTREDKV